MTSDDGGQELSFQAPEDYEMDLDTSPPVQATSELKPRVNAGFASDSGSRGPATRIMVSDDDIRKLRRLFGVPSDVEICAKKASNLRLNTIHARGVQELSSDEVLKYFEDYDPASLEWVNDLTCNVVFDDPKSAATAMIGLMAGYVENKKQDGVEESKDLSGITIIDPVSLEVPVPAENWILGKSHPKSKALLLRVATVNDKKIQGAGKYSEFYRKHGNPHYGGRKNIISKSLSEKLARNPDALEQGFLDDALYESDQGPTEAPLPRLLRMKMRADDEEEARSQKILVSIPNDDAMDRDLLGGDLEVEADREVHVESRKRSIWDRLGPKRDETKERESWLSRRSRGIDRADYRDSRDRVSVFSRLSYGPLESRDRPTFRPSNSRNIVYSNLRIKK